MNNENNVTVNFTANTTEFEAAMKRATEAAKSFRAALKSLPWYIRWMMGAQSLWQRLACFVDARPEAQRFADGGEVKPGAPYVVGERRSGCWGFQPGDPSDYKPAPWPRFQVGDGITGDENGCMGTNPDPRKRPFVPCGRSKE